MSWLFKQQISIWGMLIGLLVVDVAKVNLVTAALVFIIGVLVGAYYEQTSPNKEKK